MKQHPDTWAGKRLQSEVGIQRLDALLKEEVDMSTGGVTAKVGGGRSIHATHGCLFASRSLPVSMAPGSEQVCIYVTWALA